jgi:hypothetical protein
LSGALYDCEQSSQIESALGYRLNGCGKRLVFGFEDGFVTVPTSEFDLDRAVIEQFGLAFARDFIAFFRTDPGEGDRLAAAFDAACLLPSKAISPRPSSPIVIAASRQRSRSSRSQILASLMRQRPMSWQFVDAFMALPPAVWATAHK